MVYGITVAQILEAVQKGGEIPTTAPVMRKLLEISKKGDQLEEWVGVVKNDVALTTRLLRAVNSPTQSEEEVVSVEKMISKIPQSNLKGLLLSVKFLDDTSALVSGENEAHFLLGWLWERNMCLAMAAEVIAQRAGVSHPEEYRTFALLTHLGTLFLFHNFITPYRFVIDQWRSGAGRLIDIEEDLLGLNHLVVTHQLVKSWNLGTRLEAVFRALTEGRTDQVAEIDLSLLNLSETCTSILFENNNSSGFERGVVETSRILGIDRSAFTDLLQAITLKADSEMMRFTLQSGRGIPYVELLTAINRELGRATLSYEQMVRELELAMKKTEELAKRLEEANRKLREAASVDPLTKVYNRRYFEEFLNWNFQRAQRYGTTLGCLMVDIDHFKKVNDRFGHLTGDRVLQGVAATLKTKLRSTDIVARYGGEEFVILLPETSPSSIGIIAQKINYSIRELTFSVDGGDLLKVTVSVGYAYYHPQMTPEITEPSLLVKVADTYMYQAKTNGRDRIWPPLKVDPK